MVLCSRPKKSVIQIIKFLQLRIFVQTLNRALKLHVFKTATANFLKMYMNYVLVDCKLLFLQV